MSAQINMATQTRHGLRAGVLALALLGAIPASARQGGPEITPFRLTGVEGHAQIHYLYDGRSLEQENAPKTFQRLPTLQEEIYVLTHSYVYHPNLLNMHIGGGPLFVQQRFESDLGEARTRETLYNFNSHFNFLQSKAYPFSLYYDRGNPTVSTGLAGRFLTENTRYGLNATLREPLSPVLFNLEAFHQESQGEGFDTVVDDDIDQAMLRAFKSYGRANNFQLSHRWHRQSSASGSPNLPIQETLTHTQSTDLNTRNHFGKNLQLRFTQLLTYVDQQTEQTTTTDLRELRYRPNLNWQHTQNVRSFYRYNLLRSRRNEIDTDNQSLIIGAGRQRAEGITTSVDLHARDEETTGFEKQVLGATGTFGYQRPIPLGRLRFGLSLLYDRNDQTSTESQVPVFDEPVTLNGTTQTALQQSFIVTSTLVVTNQPKTQTYVENTDYRVIVIGETTYLQRLIGGSITDGQTVLANYEYLTGGSLIYDSFNQAYNFGLGLFRYVDVYLRYRDLSYDLREGLPTVPLNAVQNIATGLQVDYPVAAGWVIGGRADYEDQDEDISPYVRNYYETYVQTSLARATQLRFAARRDVRDNALSDEDVDLIGYRLRLSSRPWFRTTLTLDADYEQDIGGSLDRLRRSQNAAMEWRYRQLFFTLRARHISEDIGNVRQEQYMTDALLRRNF